MTDKVQLIKEEIERLKQTNGFLLVDNHEICDAYRARGYQLACDDILQFIDSLPEEHVSEDLKYAAYHYANNLHMKRQIQLFEEKDVATDFIAGAEWQKKQMKEVLQTEYEKGRFDMREEMMKDAVHAWVNTYESVTNPYDNQVSFITNLSPSKFKNKETVKVIIVKED